MGSTKKAAKNATAQGRKISDIRWDKYYEKKQNILALKIEKHLTGEGFKFHAQLPLSVAKLIIKRK